MVNMKVLAVTKNDSMNFEDAQDATLSCKFTSGVVRYWRLCPLSDFVVVCLVLLRVFRMAGVISSSFSDGIQFVTQCYSMHYVCGHPMLGITVSKIVNCFFSCAASVSSLRAPSSTWLDGSSLGDVFMVFVNA